MTLDFPVGGHLLLAFTSCHRFIGRFSFDAKQLRVSVDSEGLELAPGETWKLEEFLALAGPDRNVLLDRLAADLNRNHPPLPQPPLDKRAGWCTWYGVGNAGNQKIVTQAAEFFSNNLPQMKFIQIDEGYNLEGDLELVDPKWGDMKAAADAIKAQGMLPAIWSGRLLRITAAKHLPPILTGMCRATMARRWTPQRSALEDGGAVSGARWTARTRPRAPTWRKPSR